MKIHRMLAALTVAAAVIGSAGIAYAARGPKKVVVMGHVTAAAAPNFSMHKKGGGKKAHDFEVVTNETTVFLKSDGSTVDASAVVVGAKVQVKGVADPVSKVVTAARVLIVKVPAPAPEPEPTP